jgi:WD40 repeat protein
MVNQFIDIRLSELPADFVRLTGHILQEDPAQLGAQLSARLHRDALSTLSAQLQNLAASAQLQLLHPSVGGVGDQLLAMWTTDRHSGDGVLNGEDTLYVGFSDDTIVTWNPDRDLAPYRVAPPRRGFHAMAYNPQDKSLAFGCDRDVVLGERTWRIHEHGISALAIAAEPWAVSVDYQRTGKVWDTRNGQILVALEPPDRLKHYPDQDWGGIPAVQVTSNRVLFYDGDLVCAWNLQSGSLSWFLGVDSLNAGAFALSPDGRVAVIDTRLVDTEDGRVIAISDDGSTKRAAFSPDGAWLYTMERRDPRIYVREAATGRVLHSFIAGACSKMLVDSRNRVITVSPAREDFSLSALR